MIKVGTSSLIHEENGTLKLSAMASIAETLRTLTKQVMAAGVTPALVLAVSLHSRGICATPD